MSYRVLVLTPWFPDAPDQGRYNFIFHSVEALRRAGNKVSVLVTRPYIPRLCGILRPEWDRAPLRVEAFPRELDLHLRRHLSIPRYHLPQVAAWLYRVGCAAAVRQLVRRHGIQLIHAHTEQAGPAAINLGEELGIPTVLTLHGIDTAPQKLNTEAKRRAMRRMLCAADRLILVGEPLRAFFSPLAGRDDRFRVVHNGFFFPGAIRGAAGDRPGFLRIVSVSNLQEGKGVDLTIRALKLFKERGHADWSYTVVGDGPDAEELEALARELGLAEQIFFLGALPHEGALSTLAEADLFLLPSYREAFGVAYLEAMAAGLVTVGVAGQGPQAFIRHRESGYLVPPQDVEAICATLTEIADDRGRAAEVARTGREAVLKNFTWDRHAQRLMEVYGEVAGGAA